MRLRRIAGAWPVWVGCALGLLVAAPRLAAAQITLFQAQVTPTTVEYYAGTTAAGTIDLYYNRAAPPGAGDHGDQQAVVGGFSTHQFSWAAPNGIYQSYIQLRANPTDVNEVGIIAGPLQVVVGPDLVFCRDAYNPNPFFKYELQGSSIKYTARVCNVGSRAAGPFRLGVWYNRDAAPPVGVREDQFVGINGLDAIWYINSFPPCYDDSGLWGSLAPYILCQDRGTDHPQCCPQVVIQTDQLPNGHYKSWAKVDSADFQIEANKSNNIAGPLSIDLSLPEIVVTSFEASVSGQTVIYSVDVCNRGTKAASTFYVDVYYDRKQAPQDGNPGELIQQIPSLDPNACKHMQFVRGTAPYGTYHSWVFADADNFLTEPDKLNNRKGPMEVVVGNQHGCVDADGDGFGVGDGCEGPQDCNDADATIYPGAAEICGDGIDQNCNLTIDDGCPGVNCTDGDGDGWPVGPDCVKEDCDDTDPTVYPGAPEVCGDGKDNNCEGIVDDGCPGRLCVDADEDGYGVGPGCPGPQDTDDNDPDVHPGAAEICGDGKDNNSNGVVDDGCPGCTDNDGDGYGVGAGCGPLLDRDSNDNDPTIHPGAEELCDGIDNNGNGSTDENCPGVDCVDKDGDGWPVGPDCGPIQDCDDNDATIHPGAPEVCGDGVDQNCNGTPDDGCPGVDCVDKDGDGWPSGPDCVKEDCNDDDVSISPWAKEICADGIDNNCNGKIDEDCRKCEDLDHDGFPQGPECPLDIKQDCDDANPHIYPGAPESCQGHKDTNCDGVIAKAEDCAAPGGGCDCGGGAGASPGPADGGAGGADRLLLIGFLALGAAGARRRRPRR
jgi:hypothetical protein